MKGAFVSYLSLNWFVLLLGGWLFFLQPPAWAEAMCVDPAGGSGVYTSLQDALDDAEANGEDDTIQVVQGVYNGNFRYLSAEGDSLTLEGGYTSACACRAVDPSNTVLNGDGATNVLFVEDSKGADIVVDGFNVKNGGGVLAGGGIYVRSLSGSEAAGDIRISNNNVAGNSVERLGGGILAVSSSSSGLSGDATLANNMVTGNRTEESNGGGVYVEIKSCGGDAGTITFVNNTVSGNEALQGSGGGVYLYLYGTGASGAIRCYNNIIRGNKADSGSNDIGFLKRYEDNAYGYNNNYHEMADRYSWTEEGANIDADSRFIKPGCWDDDGTPLDPFDDVWIEGDYHLRPDSPCIDAGILDKKGIDYDYNFVPQEDFEGDSRVDAWIEVTPDNFYRYCDIGADEFTASAMPWMPLLLLD